MTNVNEVAPPGWGHTKAEKEKTKPNKPKSKIGGSAHEFDKDLKSGKFKGLPGDKTMKDKKASMFKLMWSMKNKGDKPHYKPGVKDVLKKKYQKEEKVDEKPYPPTRLFKNVPNSVVKKANKEADKVKREQEKAVLGEPPKNGPSGDSMHSKDNVYEDEKVDMVSLVARAIADVEESLWIGDNPKIDTGAGGKQKFRKRKGGQPAPVKRIPKAPKLKGGMKKVPGANVATKAGSMRVGSQTGSASSGAAAPLSMDMSLAPKGKGRKAAKALYKEITGGIPVSKKMAGTTVPPKQAPRSQRMDKSKNLMPAPGWTTRKAGTKAGQMTTASYDPKLTHFGDILRQAIAEAKKVDAIKEINKIVKTKTMGKLHGQKVDLFTASAIQQVYKAINHKNKEKMNSVMSKDIHGLLKMADFSMSKMKR